LIQRRSAHAGAYDSEGLVIEPHAVDDGNHIRMTHRCEQTRISREMRERVAIITVRCAHYGDRDIAIELEMSREVCRRATIAVELGEDLIILVELAQIGNNVVSRHT